MDLNILNLIFLSSNGIADARINEIQDGCPKDEYACLDVINSSQCIEQIVIEKLSPVTKESLVKCVEYDGTVTKLPGAIKVSSRFVKDDL